MVFRKMLGRGCRRAQRDFPKSPFSSGHGSAHTPRGPPRWVGSRSRPHGSRSGLGSGGSFCEHSRGFFTIQPLFTLLNKDRALPLGPAPGTARPPPLPLCHLDTDRGCSAGKGQLGSTSLSRPFWASQQGVLCPSETSSVAAFGFLSRRFPCPAVHRGSFLP